MEERILGKYQQLINSIESAIQSAGHSWPDTTVVTRVVTEALNLIRKTCGDSSDHYLSLKSQNEKFHPDHAKAYKGIIEAAYNDYKDGFTNLDSFIRAEIFDDFLSMAEYLLGQGYYVPAASLAGSVLEDSLRRLCDKYNIDYSERTNISDLNSSLVKSGAYNLLVSKEIIAKADIRNNADHGKYKEFNKNDVKKMIEWIREFVTEQLK